MSGQASDLMQALFLRGIVNPLVTGGAQVFGNGLNSMMMYFYNRSAEKERAKAEQAFKQREIQLQEEARSKEMQIQQMQMQQEQERKQRMYMSRENQKYLTNTLRNLQQQYKNAGLTKGFTEDEIKSYIDPEGSMDFKESPYRFEISSILDIMKDKTHYRNLGKNKKGDFKDVDESLKGVEARHNFIKSRDLESAKIFENVLKHMEEKDLSPHQALLIERQKKAIQKVMNLIPSEAKRLGIDQMLKTIEQKFSSIDPSKLPSHEEYEKILDSGPNGINREIRNMFKNTYQEIQKNLLDGNFSDKDKINEAYKKYKELNETFMKNANGLMTKDTLDKTKNMIFLNHKKELFDGLNKIKHEIFNKSYQKLYEDYDNTPKNTNTAGNFKPKWIKDNLINKMKEVSKEYLPIMNQKIANYNNKIKNYSDKEAINYNFNKETELNTILPLATKDDFVKKIMKLNENNDVETFADQEFIKNHNALIHQKELNNTLGNAYNNLVTGDEKLKKLFNDPSFNNGINEIKNVDELFAKNIDMKSFETKNNKQHNNVVNAKTNFLFKPEFHQAQDRAMKIGYEGLSNMADIFSTDLKEQQSRIDDISREKDRDLETGERPIPSRNNIIVPENEIIKTKSGIGYETNRARDELSSQIEKNPSNVINHLLNYNNKMLDINKVTSQNKKVGNFKSISSDKIDKTRIKTQTRLQKASK